MDNADVENVTGGSAADSLTGGAPSHGCRWRRLLAGGAGNDSLSAGAGADSLVGGAGADVLTGGAGTDTADYSSRTLAVTVTLDGAANDGEAGETYDADVEKVTGGGGDDSLVGSADANALTGGGGADTIDARDASAMALGGEVGAQSGPPDNVLCGAGADVAEVDAQDTVGGDCERIKQAPPSQPAPPIASPTPTTKPKPKAKPKTSKPSLPAARPPKLAARGTVKVAPNGAIGLPFAFPPGGSGAARARSS